VDWRLLNAADYGDATSRLRLFVMARRGRGAIPWPEPTHERTPSRDLFGVRPRWRAAREVIDWSLPCPSIFGRKRPLSENTTRRIEAGLRKFGGANAEAFLVLLRGTNAEQVPYTARSAGDPVPTVSANGTHVGLVQPFLLGQQSGSVPRSTDTPVPTVSTDGAIAFVVPTNYGERPGQTPRVHDVADPLPTVVGTVAHGICQPFLVPYYGTGQADDTSDPVRTLTARDRLGLVQPDGSRLDIGFRMLQPHELAAAMGFPCGYRFAGNKGEVVKQIGNAVAVGMARALCDAILGVM
jgi:DNA (cytosine-5)-methyltransferase 1